MKDLFLPSEDRTSVRLSEMLGALVQDVVRIDEDSRHFHAVNPLMTELERTRSKLRRTDPRPWSGDVRQTGSVSAAPKEAPETDMDQLTFGPPSEIELVKMREYTAPGLLVDSSGRAVDSSDWRVVETNERLVIQAGDLLYRIDEDGASETLPSVPAYDFHLASTDPETFRTFRAPGNANKTVATQISGLTLSFAGRGSFGLKIEFTGVVPVADGSDLSTVDYLKEPLKLYGPDGEEVSYSLNGDAIQISGPDTHTLYFRGKWDTTYVARQSSRIGDPPDHNLSLAPIAENLNEIPEPSDVTCRQTATLLSEMPVAGRQVTATAGGYVGGTNVQHTIHHLLPGRHYVLALGGSGSESTLSIAEPESVFVQSHQAPQNARGITWTPEGALAVIAEEDGKLVVYGINEIRRGNVSGFQAQPPLGDARA